MTCLAEEAGGLELTIPMAYIEGQKRSLQL